MRLARFVRPPSLVALALAAGCAAPPPALPGGGRYAFEDVTVIDGTGTPPRPHTTVVVEGGRIAAVFATGSRPLPAGTAVVAEARGRTVIPGLIDAHVHLASSAANGPAEAALRAAFLGGVTSVRDMGGSVARVRAHADAARPDTAALPRVFGAAVAAGPAWFDGYAPDRLAFWSDGHPVGLAPGVRRLNDTTDVAAVVAAARALGVRGVKVYAGLAPPALVRLVAAAHGAGLRVWAHASAPPARPSDLVAAGVDVLSHEGLLWEAAAGPEPPLGPDRSARRAALVATVAPDAPALVRLYDAMAARGTLWEPTLYVVALVAARMEDEPGAADVAALVRWTGAAAGAAHRRGVRIVAGTDALGGGAPGGGGPNLHAELQLLVRHAGLTPVEAIQAATENAALGVADSLGTVALGKRADLVVLRRSPAADVRNTQTVALIVRGGRLHRRTAPWAPPLLADGPAD